MKRQASIIALSRSEGQDMGRGDKRSFKGKLFKGSHGKTRPRHDKKAAPLAPTAQRKKAS